MTTVKTTASHRSRILKRLSRHCLASALFLATPWAMAQSDAAASDAAPDAPNALNGTTGTAPTFSHLWLAGSTFHPVSTPGSFAYSGAGCIHPTAASGPLFHHKLLLPEGSLVKYVRMYFYNTSTAGAPIAFFTTYNMNGGFTQVPSVSGSNTGGYSFIVSDEMNYTVDYFAEPINIAVNLGSVTDGSVRFCGVRVAYYGPPTDIFADSFED